jgi:hypothetical protein
LLLVQSVESNVLRGVVITFVILKNFQELFLHSLSSSAPKMKFFLILALQAALTVGQELSKTPMKLSEASNCSFDFHSAMQAQQPATKRVLHKVRQCVHQQL